ncbi:diacylglycerol kinase [Candidatus Arthromitus sp. SFB-mouse-Japan]|nr:MULTISPECIES: diacylglycerol kinase [unclassified Candidatus Arthromitus]EGX29018.1 diacylglycerol kinase/PAP2 family protein [Candidatus Arthromitus sp. SFB-mouse-NYU]EIA25116.1 Diacylglycerol kinase [Candidatus Arthromitus sp. SFB-2]EIA26429.1 Diacylglycerol kinase [Candidatus Arthromitus sp. SFB-4]EIA28535.1 Diacylglycerol kinase [Candidatus Arthromitus sp. SFB-co]EIA30577.1 Diacylglycerol kinase [Candidatus Arthromitus sp. SFB-mouse-SU]
MLYAVRTQMNMKIHLLIAFFIMSISLFYDITKIELIILSLTITLVVFAELVNTAIEIAIDATTNYYHPLAKIAKNISAGAVLLTALNATFIGYLIFWDKISNFSFTVINKIKQSNPYMVFMILLMVVIFTVIAKAIYGEGTPLRGGMPSGHSTISFSIATIISFITNEPIIVGLSFIMAIIVAQSRVDTGVHSLNEVIVGAILGIGLTIVILKIFL